MKDEFRQAIDTIPGLVWSALPDGSVDFLNKRWCEYTGISLQDASRQGLAVRDSSRGPASIGGSLAFPTQRS